MYKSYTIKEYRYTEISKGRGSIAYLLIDELGNERIVNAMAKSGWIKKIKSIHPIYHRETPLIEALSKAAVNDTVSLDFAEFNSRNPRVKSSGPQDRSESRGMLKDIDKIATSTSIDSFFIDKYRLIQLFVIASIATMVLMVLMNI